jgi:hypothetical protein
MALIDKVDVPEGKKGNWTVERFTLDRSPIYDALKGRSIAPGTYTRLMRGGSVVMSDTPAEQRDHIGFAIKARGHVLINGLGIGMCLGAALKKPEVTKATVVEIDPDVIELVGPHYMKDPRVEIINASAFDYEPPKGVRYGAVWHDIWDDICTDNLPEMHKLHRKYGRRADWQGSWGREIAERAAA